MTRRKAAKRVAPAEDWRAAAVIVAGGQGQRFNAGLSGKPVDRKQYLSLAGHPVLWWSVSAFDSSPSIGLIVLVVPPEDRAMIKQQAAGWKMDKPVSVVAGGKTRADSVRQGLDAVPADFLWVSIHDAVRPLVSPALIESVLKEARSHRAAIAASPSKDTVKMATREQTIQRTLPREIV